MKFTIAIQPDNYGPGDSASPMWTRLLKEAGHEVREVNVYRADIIDQVAGCHGFMWRYAHFSNLKQVAQRLLPVLERGLGLVCYPDQNTCWHYDDKIAQRYMLETVGIPIPKTWVWYDLKLAINWALQARYPLVLKLWGGSSAENVILLQSFDEAEMWINRLFGDGIYGLNDRCLELRPWKREGIRSIARVLLKGRLKNRLSEYAWELHKNYVLFQEFLNGNLFDTRITVIGNRAFGYRRFNRPNDFRASGSGNFDIDPEKIDQEAIRLAFRVAKCLKTQSIAIDCLTKGEERFVGEISYTYVSWMVHECPGHWELKGDPQTGDLIWYEGQMWPEEAQITDFLERLHEYKKEGAL